MTIGGEEKTHLYTDHTIKGTLLQQISGVAYIVDTAVTVLKENVYRHNECYGANYDMQQCRA